MKKVKNISLKAVFILIGALEILNSCVDEQELKNLPYLFRPINFTATPNSTSETFSWAKVDSATSYTLEVGLDSATFIVPAFSVTVTGSTYTKDYDGITFLANTEYYARIKANAGDALKNSKFNAIFFKSAKENLFIGYGANNNTRNIYSAYMTAPNTLDIKWKPNSNVTNLTLSGTSYPITSDEAIAGEKVITGLANSVWSVAIFNGSIQRGSTAGVVEGDVIISTPGDISAAITSATSGQVILLIGGQNYTIGNIEYKFSKNVKIRSTSVVNRSVVSMTALVGTAPTSTSAMMSVVGSSAIDSLVFENIDFTGFCDNNTAATKIGYLFSNKTACTVGNIKFSNCNIHNLGNTPMRLSGAVNQIISNLTFNGCIINEIGFGSTYAIVNSNSADYINNINFLNSTIYNFKGSLVLRTGATVSTTGYTLNSINVSNCTINQGMQDGGSARYLFDINLSVFPSNGGVTIKNSIFGQSGAALGANGFRATIVPAITGSYYTSDYVDDPIPAGVTSTSIKSKLTSYSGASTSLWNAPTSGDFKLSDTNFAGKGTAGDLRW